MRNTLILLVLFLLLAGGSWWYFNQSDSSSSIDTADRQFAVKNTAIIHKVFIADRSGETTTLTRSGDHWIYDGKYQARPNVMENLLDVIKRVEVNYIPAKAAVPNIIRDLSSNGIKVELYDQKDQLMKAFYIGGMTNDELGTYMIMEGAEQPYVTHIPSWEGGLRARFQLKGNEWRDKSIFSAKVEDIQSLSVEYPKQKNKSFKITKSNNGYDVNPFYEVTPTITDEVQQGKVEAYLVNFESLQAEAFANNNPDKDSILQSVPFCIITVEKSEGAITKATFHPILNRDATGRLVSDAEVLGANSSVERYHIDHLVGDQSEFMLVQHRVFEKIFWPYQAFFK